jgi:hypothetical protein
MVFMTKLNSARSNRLLNFTKAFPMTIPHLTACRSFSALSIVPDHAKPVTSANGSQQLSAAESVAEARDDALSVRVSLLPKVFVAA